MKTIAIVILNWNGIGHLKQFLPGVIAHSKVEGFEVEVVVADNGSTDGSLPWLQSLGDSIRTIFFEKNYGFTGGYNRALKQVDSDYYVILNSDVEVSPNWLVPLVEFMEKTPHAAACMPKINSYANPEYFEYAGAAGGYIDIFGYPFCRGRVLNVVEQDVGQYDDVIEVFWASGAAMLIRSQDFWEAGALDENFFAHMEEIDLCWRLQHAQKSVWCIPQSKVLHVGGGTLSPKNPKKTYYNHRNNLLMLIKNLPKAKVFPIMFLRFLLDYAAAVGYLFTGKPLFSWAVFRAHLSFFKKSNSSLKKRRQFKRSKVRLFPSSILIQFFLLNRKEFSKIPEKNYFRGLNYYDSVKQNQN